jgi:hypothetical protein
MFFYLLETIVYGFGLYLLYEMTFAQWLKYKRAEFVHKIKWIMLEVRLPREISKSPAAMEQVLEAFQQGGGLLTWWDRYRKGNMLNWFSLEIASFGGDIRFFIRTNSRFKNIIESYIYAQYPGVEITETEDYTDRIRYTADDDNGYNIYGSHFVLSKEDHVPIKTYIEYGLDRDPKEEYKIDPLTPMLEYMGSLKPGEEVWYQILVRADKLKAEWKKEAKDAAKNMLLGKDIFGDEAVDGAALPSPGEQRLSQTQKDIIRSIERSATKPGFEVYMRGVYLAPKDVYDGGRIAGFMGMLKPFGSPSLNGFMPQDDTSFVFPWQDRKGNKVLVLKERMFKKYVLRTFGEYYDQFDGFSFMYEVTSRWDKFLRHGVRFSKWKSGKSSFVLNTEELATLYHFPGKVLSTPTFSRISSTKSEAPVNLPV